MTVTIFENCNLLDGKSSELREGFHVLVEGERIREVSDRALKASNARVIDAAGRTMMPGLIDAHVHVFAIHLNADRTANMPLTLMTAAATHRIKNMLDRGFTTVRDVAGATPGLARALDDGLIAGPRFFHAGRALSMTGGHGDLRLQEEAPRYQPVCACAGGLLTNSLAVMADGVDGVLRAAREELRQGAHCIKIMGSGGVLSPTDPIWMNQYREDEIRAIVGECDARRAYVTAHCHPASAIRRCVDFGVRTIEHGTLIDADTARSSHCRLLTL